MEVDSYLDMQQARVPNDVLQDEKLPQVRGENRDITLCCGGRYNRRGRCGDVTHSQSIKSSRSRPFAEDDSIVTQNHSRYLESNSVRRSNRFSVAHTTEFKVTALLVASEPHFLLLLSGSPAPCTPASGGTTQVRLQAWPHACGHWQEQGARNQLNLVHQIGRRYCERTNASFTVVARTSRALRARTNGGQHGLLPLRTASTPPLKD